MGHAVAILARMLAGFGALAIGLALAVLAATMAPLAAHDWYTGLMSPAGKPCCTDRDCLAVAHRYGSATHRLEVRIEDAWWPVETAMLVAVPSPDGVAHACFERHWLRGRMTPVIRCIILPGEA